MSHTGTNNPNPVPQLLLLQVFLGHVLQVATAELLVRDDLDLAVARLRDDDRFAEVACAAIDFDAVVEELFEGTDVEDFVGGGLRAVDDELWGVVSNAYGVVEATVWIGRVVDALAFVLCRIRFTRVPFW